MSITLVQAQAQHRPALEALLRSFQLPTDDLPETLDGFTLAFEGDTLVGSVGLVPTGPYGLLRSMAVLEPHRNTGLGQQLYAAAHGRARAAHIREIWLITTTADRYFERFGFARVARAEVPEAIAGTAQFSALCPASAVVMRLEV